jgi:hypothetical protein
MASHSDYLSTNESEVLESNRAACDVLGTQSLLFK